jgi:mono/diheme cytochrome c family protein
VAWTALALAFGVATPAPADGPRRVAGRDPHKVQDLRASSELSAPAQVYRGLCIKCHDRDGRGKSIRQIMPELPDFTDPKWQDGHTDTELGRSILQGKGKDMKPMGDKLGSVDVKQMVAFIRAFRGGRQEVPDGDAPAPRSSAATPPHAAVPAPPPSARAVAPARPVAAAPSTAGGTRLFQNLCQRCHGTDGRGDGAMRASLPALPDFTAPRWHAARSDPQLVASILGGKGTQMPSFRDRLGPAEARTLAAQVRAFGPGPAASPSRANAAAADDFESRFRQLQQQFDSLDRQSRALSTPTGHTSR